jgi:hypothetical protein
MAQWINEVTRVLVLGKAILYGMLPTKMAGQGYTFNQWMLTSFVYEFSGPPLPYEIAERIWKIWGS